MSDFHKKTKWDKFGRSNMAEILRALAYRETMKKLISGEWKALDVLDGEFANYDCDTGSAEAVFDFYDVSK